MVDLILLLAVYLILVVAILHIMVKRPFALNVGLTPKTPVTKRLRVKITGNHGEKLEFFPLPEEDMKQVIEDLVALKQEKRERI